MTLIRSNTRGTISPLQSLLLTLLTILHLSPLTSATPDCYTFEPITNRTNCIRACDIMEADFATGFQERIIRRHRKDPRDFIVPKQYAFPEFAGPNPNTNNAYNGLANPENRPRHDSNDRCVISIDVKEDTDEEKINMIFITATVGQIIWVCMRPDEAFWSAGQSSLAPKNVLSVKVGPDEGGGGRLLWGGWNGTNETVEKVSVS